MKSETTTIGARLSLILKRRGWSLGRLHREKVARGEPVSLSQLSLLTSDKIDQPYPKTIRRICLALGLPLAALVGPDSLFGLSPDELPRSTSDEDTDVTVQQAGDTILVHVVGNLNGGNKIVATGERVAVEAALLVGRARLLATRVEAGGMGPHVLPGDMVVYDPDEQPRHGQVAVLLHRGSAMCAWRIARGGADTYQSADGSRYTSDQVKVLGTLVKITRDPPEFLG